MASVAGLFCLKLTFGRARACRSARAHENMEKGMKRVDTEKTSLTGLPIPYLGGREAPLDKHYFLLEQLSSPKGVG